MRSQFTSESNLTCKKKEDNEKTSAKIKLYFEKQKL